MGPGITEVNTREPRDLTRDLISAPVVTTYSLKALIDSPQFQQKIILPSGRSVSYTMCGSKTGTPILYFYGLGGSSRQIASLHAQAVRLDIKLLSIDRPGTGFTEPFKAPSSICRWKPRNKTKQAPLGDGSTVDCDGGNSSNGTSGATDSHGQEKDMRESIDTCATGSQSRSSEETIKGTKKKLVSERRVNKRVQHTCLEAMAVIDQILPGARFGMMGHSCGIYYIMRMLQLFPDRIQEGPITLLTPWVPFNECPETTSRSFKFLKHVPRGIVWALTSSMNHLGSVILSSTQALSGSLSNKDLNNCAEEELDRVKRKRAKRKRKDHDRSNDIDFERKHAADPFVLQFTDAFDKILLPALIQDMNRQHSVGYNSEIQMCISDVGFDLANVPLPEGVTINSYCGHLDNMVPIEASREMGKKSGWDIHEFKYSGHGGPRICMYALEDYATAVEAIERARIAREHWSEKND
ncbi:hypothetical protein BGZ51_009126 [Haplosporangium sp. Z 767]|nr:hypothetical protein BGZ51_009126 [Haplosporangium sp. Z 767]KAF9197072.1 hypothetical protein BGZ50_000022 [Haplosporangium sp. Z 11]